MNMEHVKKMKPKSLDGVEGILIRDMESNYYFRVKDNNLDGFTDYKLVHNDLNVVIKDTDAYAYEINGEYYLDHSPDTLGYKKEDDN